MIVSAFTPLGTFPAITARAFLLSGSLIGPCLRIHIYRSFLKRGTDLPSFIHLQPHHLTTSQLLIAVLFDQSRKIKHTSYTKQILNLRWRITQPPGDLSPQPAAQICLTTMRRRVASFSPSHTSARKPPTLPPCYSSSTTASRTTVSGDSSPTMPFTSA